MTLLARTLLFALVVLAAVLVPAGTSRAQSMYADPKARQAGDLITVVLVERTSAQRESDWANASTASTGGDASLSGGDLSGSFGLDARFNKEARTTNQSVQRDLLSGTITALVTRVDSTGNLLIQGERKLSVNGESHLLKVSGLVRPYDLQYDNTVRSYQVANAVIEYHRGGFHRRFFKPGMFVRVGLAAVLGAAVVFGAAKVAGAAAAAPAAPAP
jgi:flagellar L-ring protein precursor FlgH